MSKSMWDREPFLPRFAFDADRRQLIRMTFWEMESTAKNAIEVTRDMVGGLSWELYRALCMPADEAFAARVDYCIKHIGLPEIHFWLSLLQKSKYGAEFADITTSLLVEAAVRLGVYKADEDWDLPRGKWWLRKEIEV
ncbi:hypothetical protein [Ectopseudomonas mendocina]|nr:hypothetical protein [Pseudomonas mendocina]